MEHPREGGGWNIQFNKETTDTFLGDIRETTINLVCDHSLSDVEVEMDQINEVSHCVYESFAFSGLPCDKEALSQCEAAGYDITGLSLTRDNYYTQSGVTTFTINVCRGINSPAPCGTNTAICMRRDLGMVPSEEQCETHLTHYPSTAEGCTCTY